MYSRKMAQEPMQSSIRTTRESDITSRISSISASIRSLLVYDNESEVNQEIPRSIQMLTPQRGSNYR